MTFDADTLSRYEHYELGDMLPPLLFEEMKALLVRLKAAEEVVLDADNNLGVVNPLLVNVWRESAGMPDTVL